MIITHTQLPETPMTSEIASNSETVANQNSTTVTKSETSTTEYISSQTSTSQDATSSTNSTEKVLHHLQQIVKQVQIQRQINLHQILKSKIARCQILILKGFQVHQLLIIQQVIIAPLQRKILIVKPTRHLLIVKR